MDKCIFSCLKSYIPSADRDPVEDYLTQLFAWILENIDEARVEYLNYLIGEKLKLGFQISKEDRVFIETQRAIPTGRIDLLITCPQIILVCEHKVNSNLSENQIAKYMDYVRNCFNLECYSVLLTKTILQHTQEADISIIWADVYEKMNALYNRGILSEKDSFVICQFLSYFKDNGLARMKDISLEGIIGLFHVQDFNRSLLAIFQDLREEFKKHPIDNIQSFGQDYEVHERKDDEKEGRIGIDFFKKWTPGLFAGVIIDPTDHQIEPKDKEKGPDFVVLVDVLVEKDKATTDFYIKYINEKKPKVLEKMRNKTKSFELIENPENKWRAFVLRRPLYDILYGKCTPEDQKNAIKDAIIEGVRIILDAS